MDEIPIIESIADDAPPARKKPSAAEILSSSSSPKRESSPAVPSTSAYPHKARDFVIGLFAPWAVHILSLLVFLPFGSGLFGLGYGLLGLLSGVRTLLTLAIFVAHIVFIVLCFRRERKWVAYGLIANIVVSFLLLLLLIVFVIMAFSGFGGFL